MSEGIYLISLRKASNPHKIRFYQPDETLVAATAERLTTLYEKYHGTHLTLGYFLWVLHREDGY